MYANTTFVLVIASEKGKGKSVRAMRMGAILPDGWVSYNSATTQRSGMNGMPLGLRYFTILLVTFYSCNRHRQQLAVQRHHRYLRRDDLGPHAV